MCSGLLVVITVWHQLWVLTHVCVDPSYVAHSCLTLSSRPAHFQHLFSGSHYAAGYYVYLWADVLAADAFAAFKGEEKAGGNVFDPATAKKAQTYIYSAGNTVAPDELFRLFRGRDPDIRYLLEKKGLAY